jgi:hypothetical protein
LRKRYPDNNGGPYPDRKKETLVGVSFVVFSGRLRMRSDSARSGSAGGDSDSSVILYVQKFVRPAFQNAVVERLHQRIVLRAFDRADLIRAVKPFAALDAVPL